MGKTEKEQFLYTPGSPLLSCHVDVHFLDPQGGDTFFFPQPHRRLTVKPLYLGTPASSTHISDTLFEVLSVARGCVSKGEVSFPSEACTPSDPDEGRMLCSRLAARDFPCAFYYAEADCGDKLHIK